MTAVLKTNDSAKQIILDAVNAALEKSAGQTNNATILLEREVRAEKELLDAILDLKLKRLCNDLICQRIKTQRRIVVENAHHQDRAFTSADRALSDGGLHAVSAINIKNLMDFPVTGGKRLGDCTHAEIAASAQQYYAQGLTMMTRGKWLALIAQSVSGDKLVKDVLTEDRLHELQMEADREDR